MPNVGVYAMSKGALRQMTKSLSLEWAKDNVTVNAIAPGRFWTSMTDAVFSDDRLYDGAVRVIPMGRPGVPADLAGAAVLLASDAGADIKGRRSSWMVDGWRVAVWRREIRRRRDFLTITKARRREGTRRGRNGPLRTSAVLQF